MHLAPGELGCAGRQVATQRQLHNIRFPGGRERLASGFLRSATTCSETAGRYWHIVKCDRIWLAVSLKPQRRPHSILPPRRASTLAFEILSSGSAADLGYKRDLPPMCVQQVLCDKQAVLPRMPPDYSLRAPRRRQALGSFRAVGELHSESALEWKSGPILHRR